MTAELLNNQHEVEATAKAYDKVVDSLYGLSIDRVMRILAGVLHISMQKPMKLAPHITTNQLFDEFKARFDYIVNRCNEEQSKPSKSDDGATKNFH